MGWMGHSYLVPIGLLWNLFFNKGHILMKSARYFIILFCNKKKVRILHKAQKKNTIYDAWHEFVTQKQPPFVKLQGGKRKQERKYELGLIFPNNKWSKPTFIKDELGRNVEAKLVSIESASPDKKYRIKELIPYWEEERIYDFESKKRIRYHEMMEIILKVEDIAQIFTLNNKLFLQVENDVRLFGNKNIADADRLFEVVKKDLTKRGHGNFIFVKDITTRQRSLLYEMLESKGYKRTELFRHYSY
jgi:hypothetical protein